MRSLVLLPQQRWLRAAGFHVRRFSYPSWHGGLADNVRRLSACVAATPGAVIHLVAHSLGGLVVAAGCHCGFTLAATPLLAALVGHTFRDWFGRPRPALPPAAQIGIIAGTRRIGFGRLIPGLARPNDGVVAVDETRIATARDSIALPVSHSGMLVSRACAGQVANFLRTGNFIHA